MNNDNHEADSNLPQPLLPHNYPIIIRVSTALIICLFIYALTFIPKYYKAAKLYNSGKMSMRNNKYDEAIYDFEQSLQIIPSSKNVKKDMAICIFSNNKKDDDKNALYYLRGISLDKTYWRKLSRVMPLKYQKLFTTKEY